MNNSYRKTREAYTNLLEKIVDASLRLGLELNLQQQSALAMFLEGSSYKDIAQSLSISHGHAVEITKDAYEHSAESGLLHLRRCGKGGSECAEGSARHDQRHAENHQ